MLNRYTLPLILVNILCLAMTSYAEETDKSERLKASGQAKVGAPIPFFSGWLTNGQVFDIKSFLKKKTHQRYVVRVCNSYCQSCQTGFDQLQSAKSRLQEHKIGVIIYVIESKSKGQEIIDQYGSGWASVLSDQFGLHTHKFVDQASGPLPRTFVLDGEGTVVKIIGVERGDYISSILNAK